MYEYDYEYGCPPRRKPIVTNRPPKDPFCPPPMPPKDPYLEDVLHKHGAEHIYGSKVFHIEPSFMGEKAETPQKNSKLFATEGQVYAAVTAVKAQVLTNQEEFEQFSNSINTILAGKQDKLTAGKNIKIVRTNNNVVISAEVVLNQLVGRVDEADENILFYIEEVAQDHED